MLRFLWWRQEHSIAAIEAQTLVVREQALTVSGFEQEIATVRSALRALEEQRVSPSAADLWRETSRILPDNTWVTDWRLRDGSVSIAGYSLAATEACRTVREIATLQAGESRCSDHV